MKIGVSTSLERAPLARQAGFDFLEGNIQVLLVAEKPAEDFGANLESIRSAPLPILAANCFLPGELKCVGPNVDDQRLDRYAETAFQRAAEAGIRKLVFGSGGARNIPDGFPRDEARGQFLAYLRRIAPIAEAEDVTILLECLNRKECNFLNALDEGAAVVSEVGHPHLRLLADIYHMRMEGESAPSLARHVHLIDHVHVAEKERRAAPGTSGEDFSSFLNVLREAGYRGDITFECEWEDFTDQAGRSLEFFREQVRRAGFSS